MQSFIVLASLASELARGLKMTPLILNVTKKHFSPLRVKDDYVATLTLWAGNSPEMKKFFCS